MASEDAIPKAQRFLNHVRRSDWTSCLTYLEYSGTVSLELTSLYAKIMAISDDRLRSFLCPQLLQWCQSNDEDKNEDTNLTATS